LNAAKVKELMKTNNEYPAEVGTLISCFGIMNTDLRFLQDAPEIKKKVEVQLGPFASFALRKVAIAIQNTLFLGALQCSVHPFRICRQSKHTGRCTYYMLV
jgi:hypothetical protein